jgi:hypothetical protein
MPDNVIDLSGPQGNGFYILKTVRKIMKDQNICLNEIDKFLDEATSKDYQHLLKTCSQYVTYIN